MLLVATLGMVSCADDMTSGVGNSAEKYAYINTAFSLPSSSFTRSATDAEGNTNSDVDPVDDYEIGKSYENEIRSVLLVIANEKDDYITHVAVSSVEEVATTTQGKQFIATSQIPYDVLENAYNTTNGTLKDSKKIHLYAYCNWTDDLLEKFKKLQEGTATTDEEKDWRNWHGTVTETKNGVSTPNIWAQRSFLMANATDASKQDYSFPERIEDWEGHANKNDALDLTKGTAIKVERAAARIDFKDGSGNNNTYFIKDGTDENANTLYNVQLTEMALVNMSNQFYFLRRVSDNGLNTHSTMAIGGAETVNKVNGENVFNYVVDVDAADKEAEEGIKPENAAGHFNFCLFDEKGKYKKDNWYVSKIKDVLATDKEKDEWKEKQYKIWRYVTENTIPQPESQQKNIQSTGIVFKAQITAGADLGTENKPLAEALEAGTETLYSFTGKLYVGIEGLIEALGDETTGPLYKALEAAFKAMGKERVDLKSLTSAEDIAKFNTNAAKAGGITVYTPGDGEGNNSGYYCYYFYWNRHNDNGKAGKMGPMEFATVRNNVYKLSVTTINQLGHPINPDNDPDPIDPEDPDEDDTNFIKVAIEVLPWVVRVNEITF